MKKLTIQYLLTTVDLVGGTEQAIIHQANALARRGHKVSILSVYRDADVPHFDIHRRVKVIHAIDRRGDAVVPHRQVAKRIKDPKWLHEQQSGISPRGWDVQFSALCDQVLPDLLAGSSPDVIVAPTPPLVAFATLYSGARAIVQQEHRPTAFRTRGAFARINDFSGKIDALVSLTDRSTEWIGENLKGAQPLLLTIPNMNPHGFYAQSSCRSKVIIAAGRLTPQKRLEHLVEAFSVIADEFPDWEVRIFGEGPTRGRVQTAIEQRGLSHQVHILPFVQDLPLEMSKASIAALTSLSEGLPLVGLEAMATGVPLVSYDVLTGPAEIIQEGVNGYLVEAEDTATFAERLRTLMLDEGLRVRMGAAARASSVRYSEDVVAAQWEELFWHLTGHRTSARLAALPRRTEAEEVAAEEPLPAVVPVNPRLSADHTLRSLTAAFAATGVAWAPVAGYGDCPVLAVRDTDLSLVIQAITQLEGDLVARYTERGRKEAQWITGTVRLASALRWKASAVFGLMLGTGQERAAASDQGALVELEIWPQTSEGLYSSPRNNRANSLVTDEYFRPRGEHSVAQLEETLVGLWSLPDFPVDVVYTWVDGNDPAWKRKRAAFSGNPEQFHAEATDATRFTDRQELRYSLRSLHAFAPWVNNIYIVTDNQRPDWLAATDDRIRIIDHKEIFPDPSVLPTFNSHAIEACLHRIPGLSEHYLVMNDDFILRRSTGKHHYFTSVGQPRIFLSSVKVNDLPDSPPHVKAAQNNRRLIEQAFGKTLTQGLYHAPYAHRRSVLERLEADFPELAATRSSKFRFDTDVSTVSSLAQYYGYFSKEYVLGSTRYSYLQLNAPSTLKRMDQILRDRNLRSFAIGENSGGAELVDTESALRDFLEALLPWPSPYERQVTPGAQPQAK